MVLLDANVLVYYLDETADSHLLTIKKLQQLVDAQEQLVTSHHIVEEMLFVLSKYDPKANLVRAVQQIGKIPGLILVEPVASFEFAMRYAALSAAMNLGVNDALILQLMLDAEVTKLCSFDKKFVNRAVRLGIEPVA